MRLRRALLGIGSATAIALASHSAPGLAAARGEARSPNEYALRGGAVTISYFPQGSGPVVLGRGRLRMVYRDSARALSFYDSDLRIRDDPDLGTVVSVTIVRTVDTGSTTFSLLVPLVVLPAGSAGPVTVETQGITTVHRLFATAIGHPQRDTYSVTALRGTASDAILPA